MSVLFLTGSTGALGTSVRNLFLEAGWSVAGFSRKSDNFEHPSYRYYSVNMVNEADAEKAFTAACLDIGPPNMLIATIGGVRPWKQVKEMPAEDFRYLFELNLMSFFVAGKLAMKLMASGGSIISIGAESALQPTANKAGYIAAKAGVVALTRVLAEEGKWVGINANCIVPTVIRTPANEQWGDPNDIAKWTEPKDIASMCLFLSSDAGKAVNGATIRMTNRL